jgi:CDP-diacylglycerol--serine O-phosphatidyltransferase
MRAPVHELHVSNMLTYLSLGAGVAAIITSSGGGQSTAGALLALSAIADTLDGRFARRCQRTARQARVGHELDSLVDVVSFGVAPAFVVGSALGRGAATEIGWWMAASFYVLAAVTRLAFYNVEDDTERFVGVPAPAAALLCASSLLTPVTGWGALWPLVAGGVLMIAPLPVPRPRGASLVAFAAWAWTLVIALARSG